MYAYLHIGYTAGAPTSRPASAAEVGGREGVGGRGSPAARPASPYSPPCIPEIASQRLTVPIITVNLERTNDNRPTAL